MTARASPSRLAKLSAANHRVLNLRCVALKDSTSLRPQEIEEQCTGNCDAYPALNNAPQENIDQVPQSLILALRTCSCSVIMPDLLGAAGRVPQLSGISINYASAR